MADESENKSQTSLPKVLLVEDDPLLTKMYEAKFRAEGFDIVSAPDGVRGLEMVDQDGIDFIILDIMMPQLSGIDMLEKLRGSQKGKDIPVIILTNLSEKDEEDKAGKLGVKEYLLKANLTPSEVVEKVKKYIKG